MATQLNNLSASFILLIFPPKRFPVDFEWTNVGVLFIEAMLASRDISFPADLFKSITLPSEIVVDTLVLVGVLLLEEPGVIRI